MGAGYQPVSVPTQPVRSSVARKAWRRKGEPPASSASQAAGSMSEMLVEIFIRIESRHASGSGRSDGLTIHVIGDIASGEHAANAGGRGAAFRAALDREVAVAHVELARENARVRRVPDGDERSGDVQRLDGAAVFGGLDVHAVHAGLITEDLIDGVIPRDAHLACLLECEQPVLQDFLGAELV